LAETVKIWPKQTSAWEYLATVQLAAGKTDEYQDTRARLLKEVVDPSPNETNTEAWVAVLAKDTPKGSDRAVALSAKAVEAYPRNANYLSTYAAVLYRAGKPDEAISQLEIAIGQRARDRWYAPPN